MKPRKPKYEYPFCECDHHPGRQRSYLVCLHVFYGTAEPFLVDLATDESCGTAICKDCHAKWPRILRSKDRKEQLRLVCEGCAIQHHHLFIAG